MKCIVLSARAYEFTRDGTGEVVTGCTLQYIDQEPSEEKGVKGHRVMESSGPASIFAKLKTVPGLYDCDFRMRPGVKNKPTLSLVDASFVKAVPVGGP